MVVGMLMLLLDSDDACVCVYVCVCRCEYVSDLENVPIAKGQCEMLMVVLCMCPCLSVCGLLHGA